MSAKIYSFHLTSHVAPIIQLLVPVSFSTTLCQKDTPLSYGTQPQICLWPCPSHSDRDSSDRRASSPSSDYFRGSVSNGRTSLEKQSSTPHHLFFTGLKLFYCVLQQCSSESSCFLLLNISNASCLSNTSPPTSEVFLWKLVNGIGKGIVKEISACQVLQWKVSERWN